MKKFFDYNKITFWIGAILVVYMLFSLADISSRNFKLKQQAEKLENDISRLQSETEELSYKISYYKTDNYKEKIAREKLNMRSPGETVVIIPGQRDSNTDKNIEMGQKTKKFVPRNNIEQWLEFLFGS